MNNRFQRQQCYLCDCPRAPWAILNDFSEPICRGCCNYEGPDRIEAVIDYVRSLRKGWEHQVRSLKNSNLNSTGTSIGSSPSPGGHSNGSMDAVSSMSNTPYPFTQYHSLIPHHGGEHMRFMPHSVKPEPSPQEQQQQQSQPPPPQPPPQQHPPSQHPPPPSHHETSSSAMERPFIVPSSDPNSAINTRPDEGPHEEHPRRFIPPGGKDAPPRIPIIRRPPEFADLPELVKETLEVLNTCVPFDVRFKKEHNHIGRVFLFEAAPRTGAPLPLDFELKIHIEYPRGSENFSQSASSVAKQMYQDAMKEMGRGLSSGFKYLEYEVQGSPNEWRLLGDLLPENVRVFKEPISRNFLPQRIVTDHPSFHPMFGPPGYLQNKYRTKRKAEDIEPPGAPPRAPRRTYKEREDEQIQRHLWMQSQVDALRLSMAHLTGPPETGSLHHSNSTMRSSPMVDHQRTPAPLPHAPVSQRCDGPGSGGPGPGPGPGSHQPSPKTPWAVPSSMAALINAASLDTSSATAIKEARKTPLSSETILKATPSPAQTPQPTAIENKEAAAAEVKEEGTGLITKTEDSNERKDGEPEGHTKKTGVKGSSQLKCSLCDDYLEDTHFVQCPSVPSHKFCFPCSKDSIKKQGFGNDVFCPSGKRCPLIGSNLPWAFMQSEIQTILATKGRPLKQSKDEHVKDEEKPN